MGLRFDRPGSTRSVLVNIQWLYSVWQL